jgi:hypothetical protein
MGLTRVDLMGCGWDADVDADADADADAHGARCGQGDGRHGIRWEIRSTPQHAQWDDLGTISG